MPFNSQNNGLRYITGAVTARSPPFDASVPTFLNRNFIENTQTLPFCHTHALPYRYFATNQLLIPARVVEISFKKFAQKFLQKFAHDTACTLQWLFCISSGRRSYSYMYRRFHSVGTTMEPCPLHDVLVKLRPQTKTRSKKRCAQSDGEAVKGGESCVQFSCKWWRWNRSCRVWRFLIWLSGTASFADTAFGQGNHLKDDRTFIIQRDCRKIQFVHHISVFVCTLSTRFWIQFHFNCFELKRPVCLLSSSKRVHGLFLCWSQSCQSLSFDPPPRPPKKTDGVFQETRPLLFRRASWNYHIGDANTIWSLGIGSQCFFGCLWQLGHRTWLGNLVVAKSWVGIVVNDSPRTFRCVAICFEVVLVSKTSW